MTTMMKARKEQKEKTVEFVLALRRLSEAKKVRVHKLLEMLDNSDDFDEQVEIASAIAEIVVPRVLGISKPAGTLADLEEGIDEKAKRSADGYRKNIGDAIRKRREHLGMTQEELAKKAGLPQSHISRLEVGKHAPTRSTIERIAHALKTEPSQLDLLY